MIASRRLASADGAGFTAVQACEAARTDCLAAATTRNPHRRRPCPAPADNRWSWAGSGCQPCAPHPARRPISFCGNCTPPLGLRKRPEDIPVDPRSLSDTRALLGPDAPSSPATSPTGRGAPASKAGRKTARARPGGPCRLPGSAPRHTARSPFGTCTVHSRSTRARTACICPRAIAAPISGPVGSPRSPPHRSTVPVSWSICHI